MKRKQINAIILSCTFIVLTTVVIYGCKKNPSEKLGYSYFEKVIQNDKNISGMQVDLSRISQAVLTEAYLKRENISYDKISNSLAPFVVGKETELKAAAKAIKTEKDLVLFLGRIGMKAQSEVYLKAIKSHLAYVQKFYEDNPDFQNLSQDQQRKLLYTGMKQDRLKKDGIFRKVQEGEPCWDSWSETIQDAQDNQFWELAGLDVAFVICCVGTEGIGAPICYAGYLAGAELTQLKYIDDVNKADDKYNECVGDQTEL